MKLEQAFKKKFSYVENINESEVEIVSYEKLSSDSPFTIANWEHEGAEEYIVSTEGNDFHLLVCESDIDFLPDSARCEDVDDYISIIYNVDCIK